MAEIILWKRYSMTNLRSGAASRRAADDENFEYPEYTPNFIKLAEVMAQ